MSALRLGIVGCGDISGFTAWFARFNRKIQMTACCDIDLQAADSFAKKFRIPAAYTDYTEMLAGAALDAVYLATPHDLHLSMTRQAVEAGLAVLCEKPLAASLSQGRQMVELVERAGVKVMVNYQYRYDAGCYGLARIAQAGALGRLLYARINIPWFRQQDYFDRSGAWHSSRQRAGGGTLLTQGSHFLDVVLWAAQVPAVTAQGITARRRFQDVEVEDLALGQVELADGFMIEITSSMVAYPERAATIELYGEEGTGLYKDGLIPRLKFVGARVKAPRPPVKNVHALGRCLEAFRRYIVEDEPTLNPVQEAYKTLAVVDAVYRSAACGQKVQVED
jgi:predicted dehydrogenase